MQNEEQTQQDGLCENCLPDATVWATSTPAGGPKSYFVLIKDGETQIALELRYSAEDKKIIAEPYRPQDYDYTVHDSCDHEHNDCIMDTEEFQEQACIDDRAIRAGYKEAEGTQPHVAFSSSLGMVIDGWISAIESDILKVKAVSEALSRVIDMERTAKILADASASIQKATHFLRRLLDMSRPTEKGEEGQ